MNKGAMLAVADVIEYNERFDHHFWAKDMASDDWRVLPEVALPVLWDDCNTVGCVAGWTCAWADIIPAGYGYFWAKGFITYEAAKELGLTHRQAHELFDPYSNFWAMIDPKMQHRKDAAFIAGIMRRIVNGEVKL